MIWVLSRIGYRAARWRTLAILSLLVAGCAGDPLPTHEIEWATHAGAPTGTKFSNATDITRANVHRLQRVWARRTGDLPPKAYEASTSDRDLAQSDRFLASVSRFEATPVMRNRSLYVSTPLNRVLALDPTNGAVLWTFDP